MRAAVNPPTAGTPGRRASEPSPPLDGACHPLRGAGRGSRAGVGGVRAGGSGGEPVAARLVSGQFGGPEADELGQGATTAPENRVSTVRTWCSVKAAPRLLSL